MGVLSRFERRIEELVNRPFARAFKAEVQPVEIASALQRECDDRAAIVSRGRTIVPNSFTVALGPSDADRLELYAEPLSTELAGLVREHADEQRYAFLGPVSIRFDRDENLETGRFLIRSAVEASATSRASAEVPSSRAVPWLEVGTTSYALGSGTTTVGRGTDVDLRIDDPGVSRRHAEFQRAGGDVTVVDLGSTNGVLVDGQRVSQARLRDGAEVRMGSTTLVLHLGPGGGGRR